VDILFPMAGQGARFGHKFKPFLLIDQEPFISAAVAPFRVVRDHVDRFVFVYLEEQEKQFEVSARLREMFHDLPIETVHLERPTRGPAETIARGIEASNTTGEAFICDCDHALDVRGLFARAVTEPWDAILPVWPLEGESLTSWSVALVDEGRVTSIAEKRMPETGTGAPMGVIGCYGFRDIRDAVQRARMLDATNFSDVLRSMLVENKRVDAVRIHEARFFGDPERLARATRGTE
jgi:hypothetical protein